MRESLRFAFILLACATSSIASADNRFQVIGISATHAALRELSSGVSCCGADAPVDCHYPGLNELAKKIPTFPDPDHPKRVPAVDFRPLGVSILFVELKEGDWTSEKADPIQGTSAKGSAISFADAVFPIYEVVTERRRCTRQEAAKRQLEMAKDFAKKVGIDFRDEQEMKSEELNTGLVIFEKCRNAAPAGECKNAFFTVRGEDDDLSYCVSWNSFKIANPRWCSYSNSDRFFLLPLVRWTSPRSPFEIYQLRRFSYGIAGYWELPRFIAIKSEFGRPQGDAR